MSENDQSKNYVLCEHYEVVVSKNELGIIVDVYDRLDNIIDSNQYWDDDIT